MNQQQLEQVMGEIEDRMKEAGVIRQGLYTVDREYWLGKIAGLGLALELLDSMMKAAAIVNAAAEEPGQTVLLRCPWCGQKVIMPLAEFVAAGHFIVCEHHHVALITKDNWNLSSLTPAWDEVDAAVAKESK